MSGPKPALRILYLEDNPADAELTRRELARLAPEVTLEVVPTLAAGRERLARRELALDVVLTDLRLPDGSGLELLAEIRDRQLPLAVVVITGSGGQEAAVAALKAGADDYVVKDRPLAGGLPQVIAAAYERFQAHRERHPRPLHVLYAEPNAFDVDLTRRYLVEEAPHLQLEVVGSGEAVLDLLTRGENRDGYEVLLLDYRLPGLNALDLTKTLRLEHGLKIPIVLVTGQGNEDVAVQALRLGCDDYLVKNEGYLPRLAVVLENARQRAALSRAEARYRNLFTSLRDVVVIADSSRTIVDVNQPALRTVFGYETGEVMGQPTAMLYATVEEFGRTGREVFNRREPVPGELLEVSFRRKSGEIFTGEVWALKLRDDHGKPAGNIGVVRDITARKKLEQQYLQAQKLESIGTLAGGIAHDFNNILTAITGYGHVALARMAADDPLRHTIGQIVAAAERGGSLTRELLMFSRNEPGEYRLVDLNDLLAGSGEFLQWTLGTRVTLTTAVHPEPLPVRADRHQLQQVLVNLAINARDAMPDGGCLKLEASAVATDPDLVAAHGSGRVGRHALLSVSDDGQGMDQATRERIFEPFFTTKPEGRGTGLGLAVVYGIVQQHDGFIAVASEPGEGTTFRIYLPLTTENPLAAGDHPGSDAQVPGEGATGRCRG